MPLENIPLSNAADQFMEDRNMMTIRVFLRWGQKRELFEVGLFDKLDIPDPGDDARDEKISPERAEDILTAALRTRESDQDTVIWSLLWHTGIRIGGARALDLEDWKSNSQRLYLHHRPESDTPLKNGIDGERQVAITNRDLAVLNITADPSPMNMTGSHCSHLAKDDRHPQHLDDGFNRCRSLVGMMSVHTIKIRTNAMCLSKFGRHTSVHP